MINCEQCGKKFNNAYKNSRWCKISCSRECGRKLRKKEYVRINRENRQKLRADGRCIICKKKVKPIIVINQLSLKTYNTNPLAYSIWYNVRRV